MGNLDEYVELSVRAKNSGGPDALLKERSAIGFVVGVTVTTAVGAIIYGAKKGIALVAQRRANKTKDLTAEAIETANARGWFTAESTLEAPGLMLTRGEKFKALVRDGDVITIEVQGRDETFYVSGEDLQRISDFNLDDIKDH